MRAERAFRRCTGSRAEVLQALAAQRGPLFSSGDLGPALEPHRVGCRTCRATRARGRSGGMRKRRVGTHAEHARARVSESLGERCRDGGPAAEGGGRAGSQIASLFGLSQGLTPVAFIIFSSRSSRALASSLPIVPSSRCSTPAPFPRRSSCTCRRL